MRWPTRALLTLAAVLALSTAAFAVENLQGFVFELDASTGIIWGSGQDLNQSNPLTIWYTVRIWIDDPTMSNSNFVDIVSNGQANPTTTCASNCKWFGYQVGPTIGSVNPKDGQRHLFYMKVLSQTNPGSGDVAFYTRPQSYIWTGGVVGLEYTPNLEASPGRITASAEAVFVSAGDTYSTGTTGGTSVCTHVMPADITIYDDGVAGYFIQQHGVPCANARAMTLTVTASTSQSSITQANCASQIQTVVSALPSTIQGITLAWAMPGLVTPTTAADGGRSIVSVIAANSFATGLNNVSFGLQYGPMSPYFNSSSKAPFTDHAFRPTMMLVGETPANGTGTCSSAIYSPLCVWSASVAQAKAMIDAAITATNSNPSTANVQVLDSDVTRSAWTYGLSSLALGTNALATGVTSTLSGTPGAGGASSTVSGSNLLMANMAAPHWLITGTPFLAGAGVAQAITSSGGIVLQEVGGNNQGPPASWLTAGAVAATGSVTEPGSNFLSAKFADIPIFVQNYKQGQTVAEALWKATYMPWTTNFIGDPLAAPFSVAAPVSSVQSTLSGVTLRGVTVQ